MMPNRPHEEDALKVLLIVVLLVPVLVGSSWAQSGQRWAAYLDGEVGVPVGSESFADRYSTIGFGGGGGISAVLTPLASVIANVSYTYVALDSEGFVRAENLPPGTSVDGGAAHIYYSSLGMRLNIVREDETLLAPYVVGGVGWFYVVRDAFEVSASLVGPATSDSAWESAFGVHFGAGVAFPIGNAVRGFVEGQYQVGFTSGDNTTTIPIRIGASFSLGRGR